MWRMKRDGARAWHRNSWSYPPNGMKPIEPLAIVLKVVEWQQRRELDVALWVRWFMIAKIENVTLASRVKFPNS